MVKSKGFLHIWNQHQNIFFFYVFCHVKCLPVMFAIMYDYSLNQQLNVKVDYCGRIQAVHSTVLPTFPVKCLLAT